MAEKRILIVDDDTMTLEMLYEGLKPLGHPIDMAQDGSIALNMIQNKTYHLVISDWFMNVMDGNEFVTRLRKQRAYEKTPVMFVTSNKDISAVKQAKGLGIIKYFVKPINLVDVRNSVEHILS